MSNYETFVVPLLMGGVLSPSLVVVCLGMLRSEQRQKDTLKSEYIFSLHLNCSSPPSRSGTTTIGGSYKWLVNSSWCEMAETFPPLEGRSKLAHINCWVCAVGMSEYWLKITKISMCLIEKSAERIEVNTTIKIQSSVISMFQRVKTLNF